MASLFRSLPQTLRRQFRPTTLPSLSHVRFATQDYGSGKGNPKGEDPSAQGANPSADKEHPGAPPPKAGVGSGGPTKGTEDGHNTGSAFQSGGPQKREYSTVSGTQWIGARAFGTSSRALREDRPKTVKGLKPRILDENPPTEENQSEDVKKHNEDMKNRAERAAEGVETKDAYKDKAPKEKAMKGQWSGQGGVSEGQNTEKKD